MILLTQWWGTSKGVKTEIPIRSGKPAPRKNVRQSQVKAWAIASSPMPDFSHTEFFLGTKSEGNVARGSGVKAVHDGASKSVSFTQKVRAHAAQQEARALQAKKRIKK